MKHRKDTPEDAVRDSERVRRVETEIFGTAAGAAAGAGAGALAGPPGMIAGAVIGAAIGALASVEVEHVEHAKADHQRELDSIGTAGADADSQPNLEDTPTTKRPGIATRAVAGS